MAKRDVVDGIVEAWHGELPEVANVDLELAKRVARLSTVLGSATQEVLAEHGVTKAEYEILARLRSCGAPYRLKPAEVSRSLLLSTGGTSNLLQRMAAGDLIVREPDPADGRSAWIRLTRDGVRLAERLMTDASAAHAATFAGLPEAAKRHLANVLREVLLTIDVAAADARPPLAVTGSGHGTGGPDYGGRSRELRFRSRRG